MSSDYKNVRYILLHGWGQSAQIWHRQKGSLNGDVSTIELPGHGQAKPTPETSWKASFISNITHICNDENIVLIGWSLGGQLAISIQEELQKHANLRGLILVSTTPCFRSTPNWNHGCSDDVWDGFSQSATEQDPKLMQRFFYMMLHGDNLSARETNQLIRQSIDRKHPPTQQGLISGLNLLSELDLREELSDINIPTLVIHGKDDVIVPVGAGHYLSSNISNATSHFLDSCGHAPFLTHHAEFNRIVEQWWKKVST